MDNKDRNLLSFIIFMLLIIILINTYGDYNQNQEINELRSRIDIMEVYFPVEIPDRSWK
jgi:hypothetical protein